MKENNEFDLRFEFTENEITAVLTNKEGLEIRKSAPCNLQSLHYPSETLPELQNEQLFEQLKNYKLQSEPTPEVVNQDNP